MPACNTCNKEVDRRTRGECRSCNTKRTSSKFNGNVVVVCNRCGVETYSRNSYAGKSEGKPVTLCACCNDTSSRDSLTDIRMKNCVTCSNEVFHYGKQIHCNSCLSSRAMKLCDRCGKGHANSNIEEFETSCGDIEICSDCTEEATYECSTCEEINHVSLRYCSECGEERYTVEGRVIHSYSHKPTLKFLPKKIDTDALLRGRKDLFMGIELEVECSRDRDSAAENATNNGKGRIYCKDDGSLDCGFEAVSHPATLLEHKKFQWPKVLKGLVKDKCLSHNTETAGIHIHINKDFLSTNEQIKLEVFSSTHIPEISQLARRKQGEYSQFKVIEKEDLKQLRNITKYRAINFSNSNTIEFRMFKGTLKYTTFMATFEMVDAMCRFIKTLSTLDSKLLYDRVKVWEAFVAFVEANTLKKSDKTKEVSRHLGKYTFLLKYMKEKKVLKSLKSKKSGMFDKLILDARSDVNARDFNEDYLTEEC